MFTGLVQALGTVTRVLPRGTGKELAITSPFEGLEVLLPAREYKNRHASILLALDATLAAFDEALEAA